MGTLTSLRKLFGTVCPPPCSNSPAVPAQARDLRRKKRLRMEREQVQSDSVRQCAEQGCQAQLSFWVPRSLFPSLSYCQYRNSDTDMQVRWDVAVFLLIRRALGAFSFISPWSSQSCLLAEHTEACNPLSKATCL